MGQSLRTTRVALIVEDDPHLRELAAALLEETDLSVVECETAEEALGAMCMYGNAVVLVFADIRLPGAMDGVDLARKISTLWPHVKVLVTSGNPGDRLDQLPGDAVYIQKPWLALEVLIAAERAADKHASQPAAGR